MDASSTPPQVGEVPTDPNDARARATSTKLAVGLGAILALLCLASAVAWVFGDTAELREGVESAPISEQTLQDSDLTRQEWNDLAVTLARFGFGGLQLVVGGLFGSFAWMLSRLKPTGRTGLFVLGLLGLLGSLLLDQLNQLAVIVGLTASIALIVTTMLPATRHDLRRRELAKMNAELLQGGYHLGTAPYPLPGQHYPGGQYPPGQPWSQPGGHPGYPSNAPPNAPPGAPSQPYPPPAGPPQSTPPQGDPQPLGPQAGPTGDSDPSPEASAVGAYVPTSPPWATSSTSIPTPAPARAAPTGSGYPEPETEAPSHDAKWDPVRGLYTRWSPSGSVWVGHNPETDEWTPLD